MCLWFTAVTFPPNCNMKHKVGFETFSRLKLWRVDRWLFYLWFTFCSSIWRTVFPSFYVDSKMLVQSPEGTKALRLKDLGPVWLLFWTEKTYTWRLFFFFLFLWWLLSIVNFGKKSITRLDCCRWDWWHKHAGYRDLSQNSVCSESQLHPFFVSMNHYYLFNKACILSKLIFSEFLSFIDAQPKAYHFPPYFAW